MRLIATLGVYADLIDDSRSSSTTGIGFPPPSTTLQALWMLVDMKAHSAFFTLSLATECTIRPLRKETYVPLKNQWHNSDE